MSILEQTKCPTSMFTLCENACTALSKKQMATLSGALVETKDVWRHYLSTWCGFQSLSKMTTVSADCRLRPKPPALVLSRKTKYSEASSLKFFSSMPRSSALVVPTDREHSLLRTWWINIRRKKTNKTKVEIGL